MPWCSDSGELVLLDVSEVVALLRLRTRNAPGISASPYSSSHSSNKLLITSWKWLCFWAQRTAASSSRVRARLELLRLCVFWHQPLWIQSCKTRVYLLPRILIRANHESPRALTSRPMTHTPPTPPSHAGARTQPSSRSEWWLDARGWKERQEGCDDVAGTAKVTVFEGISEKASVFFFYY